MDEVKNDVEVASSPTEQSVTPEVTQQEQVVEPEVKAEVVAQETAPVRKTDTEAYDEAGVPWKNRAMEYQRKAQELTELKEQIKQIQQAQSQPQKYTAEELRAFAASTDNAEHRVWALNELDKVTKQEQASVVRKELDTWKRQQDELLIKQQSFNQVISRNPDIIVKDATGNFAGWNPQSPLFQRISFYMQNPEIGNNPRGLEVAEAFAMRDLSFAQKPATQQKIAQQANQLKSLQKKVLVEGSGNNSQPTQSSRQSFVERAKQTGTMKDATQAVGAILRETGMMRD
jgi:hypothetical protein